MSVIIGLYLLERCISRITPLYIGTWLALKYPRKDLESYTLTLGKIRGIFAEHARYVINQPENVKEIAKELEPYLKKYIWDFSLETKISEEFTKNEIKNLVKKVHNFIKNIMKDDPQLGEAFDLLLEHLLIRLIWLLEKPNEYVREMSKFVMHHEDDAHEYTILFISSMLLLKALSKNMPLLFIQEETVERRKMLVSKFVEIAEDLECYTLTFQLMRTSVREEAEIIGQVRTLEELKRVLDIEQ